ncbi:Heterogeneous nuclear rnp K-like protein 2 [Nakaseomyces bracarensis]|uniref:Heterogeneous nuclear rnp K-like protein 2 n=1 Tax=Nakaseomyces bracarensis TaxID=273131 RepID=A0ABR4NYR3_9SACH
MISHRVLLSLKEAAKVIGTQGHSIQGVRDKNNGVKIGISEKVPGCSDRVLTCSGEVEDVCNALGDIVEMLNQNDEQQEDGSTAAQEPYHFHFLNHLLPPPSAEELKSREGDLTDEQVEEQLKRIGHLRLLVFNTQLSSIIGKGGNQIKSLIEKHGVKLVASRGFLPDSTERLLEIQGFAGSITNVLKEISEIIIKDEEETNNAEKEQSNGEESNGSSSSRRRFERKYYPHLQKTSETNGSSIAQEYTATVLIPETYVGALAGKKGNRLANLRKFTKTKIIMEARPDEEGDVTNEPVNGEEDKRIRKFTIIGSTSRSVNLAESMLQRNLNTEIQRRKERFSNTQSDDN